MDTIVNRTEAQSAQDSEVKELENQEWIESLDYVLANGGPERVIELMAHLQHHAQRRGVTFPFTANTPYINTIPAHQQPPYPGSREIERRIKSILRWNAMAMVVRANKSENGIGGHISTYASAATLYEVAFNHFLRGKDENGRGDMVYFQGHASPGIYARAFLEGRLSEDNLKNFRRELAPGGGLSSYPHPWLMPDFWEFPTVSMGLGPIMSIYQARFNKYLVNRGLMEENNRKVWAFLGDGETDEPESLGSISLASREKLDNLIWVINCNLQRLDGPVRGNSSIIQELEKLFRGAGWNVIKVVWGSDWDPLYAKDDKGLLTKRATEVVDGEYQKYIVESGGYIREHFFGKHPELLKMVEHLSDEQLNRMRRGGHDPEKVFAAYSKAMESDRPTVILAKTIKGYGLGEAGEGRNITHQQKKLNEEELARFRTRFGIPISDEDVAQAPFYRPAEDSPEMKYLKERREELGGFLPKRIADHGNKLPMPADENFKQFLEGSGDREMSTTMAFVRLLAKLLKDKQTGKYIVPIVPDEARTFGMEALFRQCGIYSSVGQLYDPVDSDQLLYYKETKNGQILEEGITEAGSVSSFIASGTSYATHGIPTIPFFIFYSMFGLQRIGDLIWAAADMRCRGFLLGATAGRTTLNGEGLQHQDGNSHLLAYPVPNLVAYDPAYAYELEVIIRDGIHRMYEKEEDIFYYITVENENYEMPAMPEGCEEGILKGAYLLKDASIEAEGPMAKLLGSGSILRSVLKARDILQDKYGIPTQVYSVTSYKELRREALECEHWNLLHPSEEDKFPYVFQLLADEDSVIVASSDYVKAIPDSIRPWVENTMISLGTDGFGRSETREALRDFFEVDERYVTLAALTALWRQGDLESDAVEQAMKDMEISADKVDPTKV